MMQDVHCYKFEMLFFLKGKQQKRRKEKERIKRRKG